MAGRPGAPGTPGSLRRGLDGPEKVEIVPGKVGSLLAPPVWRLSICETFISQHGT